MKHLLILFFSLFTINVLSAQISLGNGEIVGKLFSDKEEVIAYASVSLLQDTTFFGGCISGEDGTFKFGKLARGEYTLKADFIGFESLIRSITLLKDNSKIDLGSLTMEAAANELSEVTITAEKSQYILKMDKKVFNVGKDVLAQGGTSLDVLDQVPQVTVDPSGTVMLRGSSAVQILINGRRSGLTRNNAIDQIDMSNIDRIEVITNPSSSFDANGSAGIINIVLKKNRFEGFKSQLQTTVGTPANHILMPGFTYKNGKLNIFGNLRWRYSDYNGTYLDHQENRDPLNLFTLNKREIEKRHDDGLSYYFGGDYNFDPSTSITLAYFRANTKDTDVTTLDYTLSDNRGEAEMQRIGNSIENRNYNQIESNFTRNLNESGGKLSIDVQYDFWNSNKDWDLATSGAEVLPNIPQNLRTQNIAGSDDLSIQSDLSWPVFDGLLKTGLKVEDRRVNNDYRAESLIDVDWTIYRGLENDLEYKEMISAGYAEYQGKIKKLSYQFGLRGEYSAIDIQDLEQVNNDEKRYMNFFPSAFLSYNLSEATTIQTSYSRRINRPSLWNIYPFTELTNINIISIGNPDLNPSYTNAFEMALSTRAGEFSFNPGIYYRVNRQAVDLFLRQDEDGFLTLQPVNIDEFNTYGFEFTAAYSPIDKLRLTTDFNIYGFDQSGTIEGQSMDATGSVWRTRLNASFRPDKVSSIQVSYQYRGPQENAQVDYLSYTDLSASLSRSFFNNVLDVSVRASNLLNTRRQRSIIDNTDYLIESDDQRIQRRYGLNLTYKFNVKGRDRMRRENRTNR